MRWIWLLLLLSLSAAAQQITITGTVKDPNGVAYASGSGRAVLTPTSTQFYFGNNPIQPTVPILQLSPTGTFSVSLYETDTLQANGFSNPPLWQFSFCNSGASICFTMTPLSLTTSQDISASIQAQSTLLPVTGGGSGTLNNSIYAVNFGVKANTQWIPDATFTNGANTISCTNNNCNFNVASDNGKICFGTDLTNDTSIVTTTIHVLPQGTLTVTGAQTATCSGGNWPGTTGGTRVFVWGSDDTTGLQNAWTAALSGCSTMILPSGSMLVQKGVFNVASTNDVCVVDRGAGYGGYSVVGQGFASTRIIPTPNFDPTTCTGGTGSNACFGGPPGLYTSNFSIWGAGVAALPAGFNNKIGFLMEGTGTVTSLSNAYAYTMGLLSWGAMTQLFTGLQVEGGSGMLLVGVHVDGMGGTNCNFNTTNAGRFISLYNQFCSVSIADSMIISGSGDVYSYGGNYGFTQGGNGISSNAIKMTSSGRFWSFGDSADYTSNTSASGSASAELNLTQANTATVYLEGDNFTNQQTGQFGVALNGNGNKAYIHNTTISATNSLQMVAGTTLTDQGGNTYGPGLSVNASAHIIGAGSITGTPVIAGNLVLSANWGTSAAVSAPGGYTSPISFTVTNGTAATGASPTITYTFPTAYLQAPLFCTATQVGGTNAIGTFTAGTPTNTNVVFTYSLTPTASSTELVQVTCSSLS